ncbi:NUDIX hydrolase [Brevibacterium samyangense]|uniref:NUDIX domain-containing protein n=1 Tax=Brevibacterium samyangense TaxID=366888 RepID=A0ABN2TFU9_9MICO
MREVKEDCTDRSDRLGTSVATNIAPEGVVVPVKPAVSVIMVRDGAPAADGSPSLEVFVQHRVTTMDFAAGVVVYPGGRVDPQDHEAAATLGADPALLEAHARAWAATSAAEDPTFPSVLIATARREVEEETGALLPVTALKPWANWITPPGRTKRFDTFFYVARGSDIGTPEHRTTEAYTSEWLSTEYILEEEANERLKLMRPTLVLLQEVHRLGSVEAIMSTERAIDPVRPKVPGKVG